MIAALFFGGSSMISNEYELAWLVYGVAALGCFWAWTFFTRWMWRYLRELLWLGAAVVLFSPTLVNPGESAMVPSFIKLAMDLAFKMNDDLWRALADLTLYGTMAFTCYVIFAIARLLLEIYWLNPRRNAAKQHAEQAEQRAEPKATAAEPAPVLRREPTLG